MSGEEDKAQWLVRSALTTPGLQNLQLAWQDWSREGGIPSRTCFDPFEFPALLPLMVLAELIDAPNSVRNYDVLYRYIGTDFSTFFDSGKVTRAHLSEIGAPFDERWFTISDAVLAAKDARYFIGNPLGTAYAHIDMEMLALPLARPDGPDDEVGFVLYALARIYPEG